MLGKENASVTIRNRNLVGERGPHYLYLNGSW